MKGQYVADNISRLNIPGLELISEEWNELVSISSNPDKAARIAKEYTPEINQLGISPPPFQRGYDSEKLDSYLAMESQIMHSRPCAAGVIRDDISPSQENAIRILEGD